MLLDDFDIVKYELQAVHPKYPGSRPDNMQEVKGSLLTDEVATLQATVTNLQTQVTILKDRCEYRYMEGRTSLCNIQITDTEECPDSSSPETVAKIKKIK